MIPLLALIACSEFRGFGDTAFSFSDTSSTTDEDRDGYSPREGDCDDGDAARHPDATETTNDGVDSNCDGEDDT